MPTRTVDSTNRVLYPFKGRDVHSATRLFVYRNLHENQGKWSLFALDGPHANFVVAHANHVVLDNVTWRVSLPGRQRAVMTRQRNVHAGVVGTLSDTEPVDVDWQRVSYNPFTSDHFYLSDLGPHHSVVTSSRWAMFDMLGKAWSA